MGNLLIIFFTTLFISLRSATSSPENHRYNVGDPVPLFVNKVGALHNPSETYPYYDFPFCRPDNVVLKKETLGEVLNGDRLSSAFYELNFKEDKTEVTLCRKKITSHEILMLRDAIASEFYFQMYYDDLPLWGFVGKVEDQNPVAGEKEFRYYLFKHIEFDVLYNGDRVIEVSAFSNPNHAVDITDDVDVDVEFTYSILWNATLASYGTRMDRYSRAALFPIHRQIHWFSFLNSIVTILLLMGLLAGLFMRRLKNDLRKSSGGDEEEDKEVGWKYIHGDVFRYPQNIALFSAVLGMGTQLLTMVFFLFVLAFVGLVYPYNRGALCTSLILIYTLTSVVGGYAASSFHNKFAETGWKRSILLTGIVFLGPLFVILSILNIIAVSYGATVALPFGTILVIFLILVFLMVPLLAFGGVMGYHFRSEFQAPSATKRFPREIPPLGWYRKTPSQMFLAGLLSCSAVVLELHHLYASLWGYKICTLPSILFVTFVILILLTAILSVGITYIQLSAEDHQWWWRSVLCGGSPAIFMFIYCFFVLAKSSMSGFLQLSFFIGYNACMCYAFFLMLGTVSFYASFAFVSHIYHAVKSE
ncbi:transmembrane 9 superfamily member 5 [Mercurialis annua]|uniref:transmembrane 9 superfamily member 5 n=1 Tax=Mercurialis annua TaxID=3986 RepID=UPI00216073D5|nr:transmembrane 9 superfamily member 5 [Mercurialis annua]